LGKENINKIAFVVDARMETFVAIGATEDNVRLPKGCPGIVVNRVGF